MHLNRKCAIYLHIAQGNKTLSHVSAWPCLTFGHVCCFSFSLFHLLQCWDNKTLSCGGPDGRGGSTTDGDTECIVVGSVNPSGLLLNAGWATTSGSPFHPATLLRVGRPSSLLHSLSFLRPHFLLPSLSGHKGARLLTCTHMRAHIHPDMEDMQRQHLEFGLITDLEHPP